MFTNAKLLNEIGVITAIDCSALLSPYLTAFHTRSIVRTNATGEVNNSGAGQKGFTIDFLYRKGELVLESALARSIIHNLLINNHRRKLNTKTDIESASVFDSR